MLKYFIILLLIIPAVASANGNEGGFHMMDWYDLSGWGMIAFPIFWILLISGIILLVVKGFGASHATPPQEKPKSALEILKERYASGEINKEKFEEMKKDIGG